MTIPKSYEALAADLASEKIISKTLLGQKEAYMMLADKGRLDLATWKQKACEAAEREAVLREELYKVNEKVAAQSASIAVNHLSANQLQHRLALAKEALKFYAKGEHYHFESGNWDSVSGEPNNILWHDEEPDFVEDGSIAKAALKSAEE